ncbi:MAG: glycosyltransferase, partial [Patescibacteria group bacterium]|nr:glycosyltransferase [Patescibacteria group bacterium]
MQHIKMKTFLSIVIPVYNELSRLENIAFVMEFLKKQDFSGELIVVDDGSTEKTKDVLQQLKRKYKFVLISYPDNKGKGYAIKKGMLAAAGQYRLFTDLDLSTPLDDFKKFLPFLSEYPVIIGTR